MKSIPMAEKSVVEGYVVEGKGKVNSSGRKKAWSRVRMKSIPSAEKSMVESKGEVNSNSRKKRSRG